MPKCSECGTNVAVGDEFCKACGKFLLADTAANAPPRPEQLHEAGQPPSPQTSHLAAEDHPEVERTATCPPGEVHNPTPMYIGGAALIITGLLFFTFALAMPSDVLILFALADMALGIWLLVQAVKVPRTPAAH